VAHTNLLKKDDEMTKQTFNENQHIETGRLLNDAFVLTEKAFINIGARYGEQIRRRGETILKQLDTTREELMHKALEEGFENNRVHGFYYPQK